MNKVLRTLVLLVILSATLLQAADTTTTTDKKEFLNRFDAANVLFQEGKIREAALEYQALLKEELTPPTWGKITFNLGMAQMRLSNFDDAIRTFETIFSSKVDDKEPGGNIMEEFRNYRFRASFLIARCLEEKGDLASAIARLANARDSHIYQAHCGTCASEAEEALRSRIAELEKKMLNQPLETMPLVPSERTAIFPAAQAPDLVRAVCYSPPEATGYWTPAERDLEGIEDTLIAYLRSENVEEKKNWSEFRRQVVGLKRGDDQLILIYYFHFDRGIEEDLKARKTRGYDPESWKKHPYVVFDGGSWFFRVLYDVKKKRFIWHESNGTA